MARRELTLENFEKIDGGRITEAIAQVLGLLIRDCEDRPNNPTARRLDLTIKLIPEAHENGNLANVKTSFEIKEKLPKRTSRTYDMRAFQGQLFFNDQAPENADQKTIDDYINEEETHAS